MENQKEIENNNNISSSNDSNSNSNINDIPKSETFIKKLNPNTNQNPILEATNDKNYPDHENNNEIEKSSNISSWILYLIVIGISVYFIFQNTDPMNIAFTSLGCGVTLFLLNKTLNRKIYKLEDDDNGINLIEGCNH